MERTASITIMQENISLVRSYLDAAKARDVMNLGAPFDEEVVWHQPGASSVSGTYRGRGDLFDLFMKMDQASGGTFRLDGIEAIMANENLVTAIVRYSARKGTYSISMTGVDLFRVEDGKIKEVWPFSPDQAAEDKFWGK